MLTDFHHFIVKPIISSKSHSRVVHGLVVVFGSDEEVDNVNGSAYSSRMWCIGKHVHKALRVKGFGNAECETARREVHAGTCRLGIG